MKWQSWITFGIVVTFFSAGIIISNYFHPADNPPTSNQQQDQQQTGQTVRAPEKSAQELLGSPAPDFSLMDVSGKMRNVSEWGGKVLVINFWATWCPPCLEEIPDFIKLQDKYAAQGLQFVGVALEGADTVIKFADDHGMNYPILVGEQEVIKLAGKFGNRIGGLPYTVILDRDGLVNFIKQGILTNSEAEQVITSLL